MKVFGLSNQGVTSIGLLTLVLWGVLWEEHSLNVSTQQTYQELLEEWPATPAQNAAPEMLEGSESVG